MSVFDTGQMPGPRDARVRTPPKSHTAGRGAYHVEFSHYDEVPSHLQSKIITRSRADR